MRLARRAWAFGSAPRPMGSIASSSGRPMHTPAARRKVRRSSGGSGMATISFGDGEALISHFAKQAGAAAEAVQFEAHLLQHAHEQVGQRLVVLAVEGYMPRVLKPPARQQ